MSSRGQCVFVYNRTKETFLAFQVRVADSIWGRMVGLLGSKSLQPNSGVWLIPTNWIHTIGMLFSFDIVLIDKHFRVVGLREMVRPFTITRPNFRAESAIELPIHTIYKSRTEIGDELIIERYEARKPPDHPKDPRAEVEGVIGKPQSKKDSSGTVVHTLGGWS